MNVLMYPIAPEDDFPDEFCAIRQGSGEHWFYTPVGEDASWMLFRAESENANLREDLEFERSENGWAREFLNRMGQKCGTKDCPSLVAYVTKLEAENAKLRELVNGLEHCSQGFACDCCPLYDPSGTNHHGCESLERELGVEVEQ